MFAERASHEGRRPARAPRRRVAHLQRTVTRAGFVAGLQRAAGNRATARWLSRSPLPRDEPPLAADAPRRPSGGNAYTATVAGIGEFEVISFGFGDLRGGSAGDARKTRELLVTLRGRALPWLAQAAAEGRPIERVAITGTTMTVTVTDCAIASYSPIVHPSPGDADKAPVATVAFDGTVSVAPAPARP